MPRARSGGPEGQWKLAGGVSPDLYTQKAAGENNRCVNLMMQKCTGANNALVFSYERSAMRTIIHDRQNAD